MQRHSLLIELGTEELPPKSLKSLHDAFHAEIVAGLLEAELIDADSAKNARPFASPRRLAVLCPQVAPAQPDQTIERRGPAIQAAFDEHGEPTRAAQGFAKSCGVDVADLQRLSTDKGEWLSYSLLEPGKPLAALIKDILDQAIKRLPIPKRMRWGDGDAEFVRPVKWLLLMHGDKVVPCEALDIQSGNTTRGHRFHSNGEISITDADSYPQTLLAQGHVIADFKERQTLVAEQVAQMASDLGGKIDADPALLDEVTGLIEYPSPISGSFSEDFLSVPQECLVSSMRDHQKYFHVVDEHGKLLPNFITISNIQSSNPDQVRAGNEKVLRARLSDAQFFWETDQKTRLEDRIPRLASVLFHAKLGSLMDKTKRLESLAGELAPMLSGDQVLAQRGAKLAKADLVSDMVGEFDELQGIMGHYYADLDGEDVLVGQCVEQHYWPKFAGDQLPNSPEAQAVALADKLDSLVGIFASGEVPTGDKDPYGLRRAALSILRILIEHKHPLGLSKLVALSADVYADQQEILIDTQTQASIVDFVRGRLLAFYQSQGIATTIIKSVMACSPDSPLDFDQRVKAVQVFQNAAEAKDLASANKRISNILKKQPAEVSTQIETSALHLDEELALLQAIEAIESECQTLFSTGDYQAGLSKLATLRTPVDDFFESVMVMSDNQTEQKNRLAMLKRLQSLFLQVADIALLQG